MKWVRENSLGLTFILLFAITFGGQFTVGRAVLNEERLEKGYPALDVVEYVHSGHFLEATSENWESEFLQMAAYVLLTIFLRQKGSAESKNLKEKEEVDELPAPSKVKADAPWPVRKGGLALRLYSHSLSIAFGLLFFLSFFWHMYGGWRLANDEQVLDRLPLTSFTEFVASPEFWFQSLQNWQSEFLSVAAIVLLSIWLRQKGSPESKPVAAPHSKTGK